MKTCPKCGASMKDDERHYHKNDYENDRETKYQKNVNTRRAEAKK